MMIESVAVAVLIAWQVFVAIVLILVVRQVTVLSVRSGLVPLVEPPSGSEVEVGTPLPVDARGAIPKDFGDGVAYLVWLTTTCASCRHLLREISEADEVPPNTVLLVTGSGGRSLNLATAENRHPTTLAVAPGDHASRAVEAMRLRAAPTVVEVEGGVVTGWSQLSHLSDMWSLVEARKDSNASSYAETGKLGA